MNNNPSADQPRLKQRVKRSVLVGVVVAAVAVFLAGAVAYGFTGSDSEVRAAADRFEPPAGWVLASEKVTPDYRACWGGGTCPEVVRAWEAPEAVTTEYLQTALDGSGLDAEVSGECPRACDADGSTGGFPFQFTVSTPNAGSSERKVVLTVG